MGVYFNSHKIQCQKRRYYIMKKIYINNMPESILLAILIHKIKDVNNMHVCILDKCRESIFQLSQT